MSNNIEIYVAAHKIAPFAHDPGYIPIHVGKANSQADLGLAGDDTGDNISSMNPYYCELTALYWLWKNSRADIKGLVHYRRYLAAKDKPVMVGATPVAASDDFTEFASGFDIIIPTPIKFINNKTDMPISNEQQYSDCTVGLDLALTREAIQQCTPEYVPYWDFVMRSNVCSICNIMIGRANVIDDYCEWLFRILFHVERWVPYRDYNTQEARVFGFLAERLMNVWIAMNRKSVRVAMRHIVMPE